MMQMVIMIKMMLMVMVVVMVMMIMMVMIMMMVMVMMIVMVMVMTLSVVPSGDSPEGLREEEKYICFHFEVKMQKKIPNILKRRYKREKRAQG